MQKITSISKLRQVVQTLKAKQQSIGFVPTMGALHEGHLRLIDQARKRCDCVVVSIFVNPKQFNQKTDLKHYPRPTTQDMRLAKARGTDILFMPSAAAMDPPGQQTFVEVEQLSKTLEGAYRPGHFRGVTTVVTQLFNLVQPDKAFFGQKDAQQATIIQQMVRDLHFPIQIVVAPTVREKNGLAMSSRNQRLSTKGQTQALVLRSALQEAKRLLEWGEVSSSTIIRRVRKHINDVPGTKIDYVSIVDPVTFEPVKKITLQARMVLAVWVEGIRLIDNDILKQRK